MFWNRTTTTTTTTPANAQEGAPALPIVQAVPVAIVADAAVLQAPTYNPPYAPVASVADAPVLQAPTINRPYEPIVPVPVASVTAAGISNVATTDRTYQPDVRRSYSLVRIGQFIWLFAAMLEALFAVRVILKLLAANPEAGFARFITNATTLFLAPFTGLVNNPGSGSGSMLEFTTLIAMLVYALLAWGIIRLLWIVFERRVAR